MIVGLKHKSIYPNSDKVREIEVFRGDEEGDDQS
jgi:hypothetical protein